jgi:hypothetical protein
MVFIFRRLKINHDSHEYIPESGTVANRNNLFLFYLISTEYFFLYHAFFLYRASSCKTTVVFEVTVKCRLTHGENYSTVESRESSSLFHTVLHKTD